MGAPEWPVYEDMSNLHTKTGLWPRFEPKPSFCPHTDGSDSSQQAFRNLVLVPCWLGGQIKSPAETWVQDHYLAVQMQLKLQAQVRLKRSA